MFHYHDIIIRGKHQLTFKSNFRFYIKIRKSKKGEYFSMQVWWLNVFKNSMTIRLSASLFTDAWTRGVNSLKHQYICNIMLPRIVTIVTTIKLLVWIIHYQNVPVCIKTSPLYIFENNLLQIIFFHQHVCVINPNKNTVQNLPLYNCIPRRDLWFRHLQVKYYTKLYRWFRCLYVTI